jgi:HK97 family phage portal protein
MGWLDWVNWIPGLSRRDMTLAELDRLMDRAYVGQASAAGREVSVETALQNATVWACVRVIAETIASLPCITYRRLGNDGKRRATEHRLYDVLHALPNPEMTAFDYWEVVATHLLTWGNHYSQIEADDYGAKALWPLDPSRVTTTRQGGRLAYSYRQPNGTTDTFDFSEIFHVHGLSWNGVVGLSVVNYAREAIGLGLATEEYGARYFGNGARPGGVLEHPARLSKDSHDRLKADWEEMHQGPAKAHKLAILEEGMKWHATSLPPEDSQFLETRHFQVEEIARWYRVPLHMIGEHTKDTSWGSGIEQQSIGFVVYTIRPWLVRIEQAIQRDLIGITAGKRDHYAEFLVDGLLRGDIKSRYEAYSIGRQNGWLNGDDIHRLENMNPMPDGLGKVYLVNGNMVPIDQAGQKPERPPSVEEPAPAEPAGGQQK